jgi:ubiquinone/menaquinone biosynthesis C-methylase UbiE
MTSYPSHTKLSEEGLSRYWKEVSRRHLKDGDRGLGAICYAGMPLWFNSFLDRYQRKAFARLLTGVEVPGGRVLDVGTGVGRWARWFAERGATSVTGIDIEPARLAIARSHDRSINYLDMPADQLGFAEASFDIVSCVTVLQHVPDNVKHKALAEFSRVLKPGGKAVIFELTDIRDQAHHVFPLTADEWESAFARCGLFVQRRVGEQYTPILRFGKAAYSLMRGSHARAEVNALKQGSPGPLARALVHPLRVAVVASYPIEEIVRFAPSRFAAITGFLLTKSRHTHDPEAGKL